MTGQSVPSGEIRPLGDRGLLIGASGPSEARRLVRLLTSARIGGVTDVVGGLATVTVSFHRDLDSLEAPRPLVVEVVEEVMSTGDDGGGDEEGALVPIPCAFDGPDLAEVAQLTGCRPERVVELLTAQPLTVAAVGFSPGFAYLDGLPAVLRDVPRRSRPRPAVPAGAVALAHGHAAVYPTASPGGWQLIGRTDQPLFTPWEAPYARLAPGDRVHFFEASRIIGEIPAWSAPPTVGRPRPAGASRGARVVFEVQEAGMRTVFQDGGRRGLAALGVPAAGPADPFAYRLANRLVGNRKDASVLETAARGPTLRCLASSYVAVVGGTPEIWLDRQPLPVDRVVPVHPGQRLIIGPALAGFRSYVAVAGGFVSPRVLGSCSSDQLSGLGPGPIQRGELLWADVMEPPLGDHLRTGSWPDRVPGAVVPLRVVPGPHPERFAPGMFESLASMRFTVDTASNRVGLRLRGDRQTPPLMRGSAAAVELDSQGTVTGAVQVPPDGEPVILLTDHATLGGYPVVAVVASADHGVLGQCPPGATVMLVPIDIGEADHLLREQRRMMDAAVVGHYPLAVQ